MSKQEIIATKNLITQVKSNPQLLHSTELTFVKDFIESFGGVVPPVPQKFETVEPKTEAEKQAPTVTMESDEEELIESDVELDNTGVLENADPIVEDSFDALADIVSEENIEKANEKKREGISLYNEGKYEKAVEEFSEAIKLNPGLALLYAKRGQCYLKLNKPNACISDCSKALEINPDNAAAYKFRGRAKRLLGLWLEAAKDLRSASKIDFDEQVDEWLKEVTPNARKLEEHQRKYERLQAERDMRERQKRAHRVQEEVKAASSNQSSFTPNFGGSGSRGDFKISADFMDLVSDPEIQKCFEDPEVMRAFGDMSSNPSNIMKYAGNPKIMTLFNKISSKLNKGGKGFPGSFPGAGGFSGFGGASGGTPPSQPDVPDDIGLD